MSANARALGNEVASYSPPGHDTIVPHAIYCFCILCASLRPLRLHFLPQRTQRGAEKKKRLRAYARAFGNEVASYSPFSQDRFSPNAIHCVCFLCASLRPLR